MKPMKILLSLCCLALVVAGVGRVLNVQASGSEMNTNSNSPAMQSPNKLVYADFETKQGDRPVSARGGYIQLMGYQASGTLPTVVKGAPSVNPPAPELVRLSKDSPNLAAAFDFELKNLNDYAGAGIQINGLPDKDGKPQFDDVSGYKFLSFQLYAKGINAVSVEFVSRGQGMQTNAPPMMRVKLSEGFNTYRVPLKSIEQPNWADIRVKTKDWLAKLTQVNIVATCNQCTLTQGTIVVDNVVFEN